MNVTGPKIRNVELHEYCELTAIHLDAFKGFFLTSLGKGFLNTYYRASLKNSDCIAVAAYNDENKMIGFAIGTILSKGYHKRLLLSNPFSFLIEGISIIISKPAAVLRLLRNIEKSPEKNDDGLYAELLSIGVLENVKGSGTGRLLIERFEQELVSRHCRKAALTTDYFNNDEVVNFYFRRGYHVFYEFNTYPNRKMYKLIKDI
jgi:GNAT superfamily N-acetyltransferase